MRKEDIYIKMLKECSLIGDWYINDPDMIGEKAMCELFRLTQQPGCSLLHFETHQNILWGLIPLVSFHKKGCDYKTVPFPIPWLQMRWSFIEGIADGKLRAKTTKACCNLKMRT